jgi:hypothetical protein
MPETLAEFRTIALCWVFWTVLVARDGSGPLAIFMRKRVDKRLEPEGFRPALAMDRGHDHNWHDLLGDRKANVTHLSEWLGLDLAPLVNTYASS